MSFFNYLSCSRALPEGVFGFPEKAVYDSYSDYYHSEDYRIHKGTRDRHGTEAYAYFEKLNCEMPCKVIVYKDGHDRCSVCPRPIKLDDCSEEFRKLFRFPYNYAFDDTLEWEYLRTHLLPGDQADFLQLWEGHGEEGYPDIVHRELDLNDPATYPSDGDWLFRMNTNMIMHITPLHTPLETPAIFPSDKRDALRFREPALILCLNNDSEYGPNFLPFWVDHHPRCEYRVGGEIEYREDYPELGIKRAARFEKR